jgi:hypothetical protein
MVVQEASAESKYLNGLGIARERKAIVDGLRGSVEVRRASLYTCIQ